jgi:hypothetical protein
MVVAVEHSVGLVDHQQLDPGEQQLAALEMVEEPSGSRDQHVDATGDLEVLVGERDAADQERDVELVVRAVALEILLDLGGEFAGRLEDQRARHPGPGPALFEQREHRQSERRGLAGAGLGDAQDVTPREDMRNGLGLDRGRRGVARGLDGLLHLLA